MIVHYDENKRNDLVFTISVDENSHIEILIDQQQPPCGDFKQVGHYSVPVPEEPAEIFTIKRQPPKGQRKQTMCEENKKYEADKVIAELKAENDSLLQQNHEICEALSVMYSSEEYNQLKAENERLKAQIEELEHDLHRMRIRYECEG